MPYGHYSHKYKPDKLRKLIQEGKTANEIIEELAISPWSLKEHLLMLQQRDKRTYEIEGLYDRDGEKRLSYVNEGVIFSPEMLRQTGFDAGGEFEMITWISFSASSTATSRSFFWSSWSNPSAVYSAKLAVFETGL